MNSSMKEDKRTLSLSSLLRDKKLPEVSEEEADKKIKSLQLRLLRIQQGMWHNKKRAIIIFEGFDAAGKGGAIRKLTEKIDPRGIFVHAIGPPTEEEQAKHYLYRFWRDLPQAGAISVFDRSWYGRVLVERVEGLIPKKRYEQAYDEINEFEKMLINDDIDLVKIFLAIHRKEQLKRFEERLKDPYKQWKLTQADLEAHSKWGDYVKASDDMFRCTHTKRSPWHLIPADSKPYARQRVLEIVVKALSSHEIWMEETAAEERADELKRALKKIEKARHR